MRRINNYEKQFSENKKEKKKISEFKLSSSLKVKKSKINLSIDLLKNKIVDTKNDPSKTFL